ncbi:hypothetical protein [Robinsoniella peoriensis]|uniref:hypothetical protein n=1 Tax=Robinsoniella peoriensis TaxID=180332 RepID=UPI00363E0ED1
MGNNIKKEPRIIFSYTLIAVLLVNTFIQANQVYRMQKEMQRQNAEVLRFASQSVEALEDSTEILDQLSNFLEKILP